MRHYMIGVIAVSLLVSACQKKADGQMPLSAAGVKQATAKITTNSAGRSVEQENIIDRVQRDNRPGSIKHLYVISAYSGQVLIYSTVRGKVTSSGKRLTPTTAQYSNANDGCTAGYGMGFTVNGITYCSEEMVQDDGTYGSSIPYLFWFDSKGVYHQHYPEGGQIIHISDQPMSVPRVILNMETQTVTPATAP